MTSDASHQSPLDREISLQLAADRTETGLSLSGAVRTRFLAALDGLLGAVLDVPTAYLEAAAARRRRRTELDERLILEAGATLSRIASNDDGAQAALLENALGRQARIILNRRRVVEAACKELEQPSRPALARLPSEDDGCIPPQNDPAALEDDWLDVFATYVDRASTDRMQKLWGAILAGQIRAPGAFSLPTLRIISELDQHTAEHFSEFCRYAYQDGLIPRAAFLPVNVATFLQDHGLVSPVLPLSSVDFEIGDNGRVEIALSDLAVITHVADEKKTIRMYCFSLSRSGQELARILPIADPEHVLEAVASALRRELGDPPPDIHLMRRTVSSGYEAVKPL